MITGPEDPLTDFMGSHFLPISMLKVFINPIAFIISPALVDLICICVISLSICLPRYLSIYLFIYVVTLELVAL